MKRDDDEDTAIPMEGAEDEEIEEDKDEGIDGGIDDDSTVAHAHLRRCIAELTANEGGVEGTRIHTTDDEGHAEVFFDTVEELISFLAEEVECSWCASAPREDGDWVFDQPDFETMAREQLIQSEHAKTVLPPDWLLEL